MRFNNRPVRAALVLTAIALVATGCGSDDKNEASDVKSDGSSTVRVALFPIPQLLPLWIGVDNNCFKKEGITIDEKSVTSGLIEGMQGGAYDIVFSGYPVPFQAIDKGLKISMIAEADRGAPGLSGIYVPGNSDIQSPADLEGKTVATLRKDLWQWYDQKPLEEEGVDYSAVKPVVVPFENTLSALQRGTVNAALITEPNITVAKDRFGARMVVDAYDQASTKGLGDAGYFATSEWAKAHPDKVAAFQKGLECGAKIVNEDPTAAATKELPKHAKIPADTASRITLPKFPETTDAAQVQRVIDMLKELGTITSDIQATNVIAN